MSPLTATSPTCPAGTETPTLSTTRTRTGLCATPTEAYRSLEKLALRLREIDPHSPAPLLALKAARWGSMDFQEIVQAESKEGVEMANLLGFLGLGK